MSLHADSTFRTAVQGRGGGDTLDGRTITEVEEYNRGSAENPMTAADLRAKFDENAAGLLDAAARDRVADAVNRLDTLTDARTLVDLVANA